MNKYFHFIVSTKRNVIKILLHLFCTLLPPSGDTLSHTCVEHVLLTKCGLIEYFSFALIQMSYSTGRTVSLWQSTTRGAFSGCGCTTPVDCFPLGKLSTRFRGSWRIPPPHSQERKNWGL